MLPQGREESWLLMCFGIEKFRFQEFPLKFNEFNSSSPSSEFGCVQSHRANSRAAFTKRHLVDAF